MAKSNLGRKQIIGFLCPDHSQPLREVRAGTQAETEAGVTEESCLLACSAPTLMYFFSVLNYAYVCIFVHLSAASYYGQKCQTP